MEEFVRQALMIFLVFLMVMLVPLMASVTIMFWRECLFPQKKTPYTVVVVEGKERTAKDGE